MSAHTKLAEPKKNRLGLWQQEINLTFRLPLPLREDLVTAAIRMGIPLCLDAEDCRGLAASGGLTMSLFKHDPALALMRLDLGRQNRRDLHDL